MQRVACAAGSGRQRAAGAPGRRASSCGGPLRQLQCVSARSAIQKPGSRRGRAAIARAGGTDLSPEEAAAYDEFLAQKKAAKTEALSAAKRKRKFNPLHSSLKLSPAEAGSDGSSSEGPAADNGGSSSQPAAAAAAAAAGAAAHAQPPQPQRPVLSPAAKFAARPRAVPAAIKQAVSQRAAQAQLAPSADAPLLAGAEDAPADDEAAELEALLERLLAGEALGEEDIPEAEEVVLRAQRRVTPAQRKATQAAKRVVQRKLDKRLREAREAAAAGGLAGDDDDGDDDDEAGGEEGEEGEGEEGVGGGAIAAELEGLDWQALGQYEQLESYLKQQQRQAASGRLPRPAAAAAKRALPAPPRAAAAAAAAPQRQQPAAAAIARASQPPAAKPAPAAAQLPAGAAKPRAVAAKLPAAAAAARPAEPAQPQAPPEDMAAELDELEQLVNLFEAMDAHVSGRQPPSAQKPGEPAADPGEAILQALLGGDWEAELMDDLASVVDAPEPASQQQQQQLGAGGAGEQQQQPPGEGEGEGQGEEEEGEPWADEVTTLLLGLVAISHEKYVAQPLPLPGLGAVSEDARAQAFWDAPFSLLVLDDSPEAAVEYANAGAAAALGASYLDLFGRPAHELVGASLNAQTDWAYAARCVDEGPGFSVELPQLQLADACGAPLLARGVTLWRVDSLEGTPVGMALLVRSWQRGGGGGGDGGDGSDGAV